MVSKKQPYKVSFETVNFQSGDTLGTKAFIADFAIDFTNVNSFIIWNKTNNRQLYIMPANLNLQPGEKFTISGRDTEIYDGKIYLRSEADPAAVAGNIIVIKKQFV